jgi:hypothetical protein
MSGAIHPLPQYASMAWYSVKERGQLHLYLERFTLEFRNSVNCKSDVRNIINGAHIRELDLRPCHLF